MGIRPGVDDRTTGVSEPSHARIDPGVQTDNEYARLVVDAMGTRFEVFVSAARDTRAIAEEAIRVIEGCHADLTRFEPGGIVWRVNHAAGESVPVGAEIAGLLGRCSRYAHESGNAFSVIRRGSCFVPMSEGLTISDDGRRAGLHSVDHQLDLGGVAKGYAFDLVREAFGELPFEAAFLHGGSSTILGLRQSVTDYRESSWTVEIDPGDGSPSPSVRLTDRAMSVSSQHGDRPGHIVDPRTGEVAGGVGVAACIGESAEETDAWATALAVLGERPACMPQRLTSVVRSRTGWAVEGPDVDAVGLPEG